MSVDGSIRGSQTGPDRTRFGQPVLDDVDRHLLSELERDGRISNKELAALVGIAPSTCHARVRALRESGVLRGFHAQVDPEAVGRGLQAMIAVRLQPSARARLSDVAHRLVQRPEVRDVYLLGGVDDVLVHVAVRDSPELRAFVLEHLSTRPEVAHTQTSLVFEHVHAPGTAAI
ncbi:Lrp/AsnC family transcriptional regulator [uncultured Cellulomonas sp.]|uniref:Lrp/AsnC family transcriptional regulator n=1 Tax=uncultured Cellulomonas sp. TaxID=189682 RepID=UPI0028ECADBA|nr:Lrp/AsnC family transcriptional regulator [uncultured Cellulomonas sp.]